MGSPLMVVQIINICGMACLESENDPPVGSHLHGPEAFVIALQRVESQTGAGSCLQAKWKHSARARMSLTVSAVVGVNAPLVATLEKPL